MTVVPASVELDVGGSAQLSARNAAAEVTWESSDSEVATVSSRAGLVTARRAGTAVITARSAEDAPTAQIRVRRAAAISTSTASVVFEGVAGGADPPASTVQIGNDGESELVGLTAAAEYPAGQVAGWLRVELSGSTAPATLTVQPASGELAAGKYAATVRVRSSVPGVAEQSIAVTFEVDRAPVIALSETAVTFSAVAGGSNPPTATVSVTNGGGGTVNDLSVISAQNWLAATLDVRTAPATLTLAPKTPGLLPGTYTATVRIRSSTPGVAEGSLTVRLVLESAPAIRLSSSTVRLKAVAGGSAPAPATVHVSNSGGGTLDGLSVEGAPAWLSATLSARSVPAVLTLSAGTAALGPGTYTADLQVRSSTPGVTAGSVFVTLEVEQKASISLSAPTVEFNAVQGAPDPAQKVVEVTNAGGGSLGGLTVDGVPSWLVATLSATTAPATLALLPKAGGLSPGTYTTTVRIRSSTAGVADASLAVTIEIASAPTITLSASAVLYIGIANGKDPPPATVTVSNGGGGSLDGLSVHGAPSWLVATLSGSTAPAVLTLTAKPASLSAGMYTATLVIRSSTAGVAEKNLAVTFEVQNPPAIALSASAVSFTATAVGSDPAPSVIDVSNGGGGTLGGLSIDGQPAWLVATLSSTRAPAILTLTPRTATLEPGSYTASLRIRSSTPGVTERTVTVALEVKNPPSIALSTTAVAFSAVAASPADPTPQVIQIANGGGGTLSGLSVSGAPAWIVATLSGTAAPATLSLQPRIAGLEPGEYFARLTVASTVSGVGSRAVDLKLTITSD